MPASDFELALKGLRPVPPSRRLEDAIGRMLASAGEGNIEDGTVASELTSCKPVVPGPELEEALEAVLPVDVETENLLHRLQPAPIRAEIEEELEVELAEDLAFEAWLSDARPSAQSGTCERAVGAQIGFHSLESADPHSQLARTPGLSELDVPVVRPRVNRNVRWLAAAGLAAAIVISVQAGFLGSGFWAPKGTEFDAQSIAEAAEMFKNRSDTPRTKGDQTADTGSELSRFGGGATADGGRASSLSSGSPAQGGPSDTVIPWSGAIPHNVQEALAAMTQGGAGTGLRIVGGQGDLAARLERKQGEPDTSGGVFGGRFMAVGDTGKSPSTSVATTDTGKKGSSNGTLGSEQDAVPSVVRAIADGDLAKVLPSDVLDRLSELPKLSANVPNSSVGPSGPSIPDIKVSSMGPTGLTSGPIGEVTVSAGGLGTADIPTKQGTEGGGSTKGDSTTIQIGVPDRNVTTSDGVGIVPSTGLPNGKVTSGEVTSSSLSVLIFTQTDDNVIVELREKRGQMIAGILTLGGEVLASGPVASREDLIDVGQKALMNIKTAVVPKKGD
ncbi:MAG: hypothetical protein WCO60_02775 [Verrucomicrobiota bacterium]